VRLVGEPLLLLLVGCVLPDPRRNLRYAVASLIAIGCVIAAYGLLQQLAGADRLVSLGYSYSAQVRTINGQLRSFGTLDDPFEYAAVLLLAFAAVIFWLRRGQAAWWAGSLLALGAAASLVRTLVLVTVGYVALALMRAGRSVPAVLFLGGAIVASSLTLVNATGTQGTTYAVFPAGGSVQYVTEPQSTGGESLFLNGRLSAWSIALGSKPLDWLFGRGVGAVGTAAARSTYTFSSGAANSANAAAVDSAYFATIADVGLAGLAVALALWWRLAALSIRYARLGRDAGWLALAIIACILLDGLTRSVFTEFPTMYLGMLVVGIALASAATASREDA